MKPIFRGDGGLTRGGLFSHLSRPICSAPLFVALWVKQSYEKQKSLWTNQHYGVVRKKSLAFRVNMSI